MFDSGAECGCRIASDAASRRVSVRQAIRVSDPRSTLRSSRVIVDASVRGVVNRIAGFSPPPDDTPFSITSPADPSNEPGANQHAQFATYRYTGQFVPSTLVRNGTAFAVTWIGVAPTFRPVASSARRAASVRRFDEHSVSLSGACF